MAYARKFPTVKRDLYQEVTDRILAELATGAAPWVKPWRSDPALFGSSIPQNAVTGRPYRGTNVVILWSAKEACGYRTSRWLTFKQAKDAGGHVRSGEKGTAIIFVKRIEVQDRDSGDPDKGKFIPLLKAFTVFNLDQCDGLPESLTNPEPPKPRNAEERVADADGFIRATLIDFREGNGEAYYSPTKDFVSVPPFAAFKSADHYYATSFHELGHATGHENRLAREIKNPFGSKPYAQEELVAELTAAFMCAEFGFDGELRHAGYIASWIKLLTDDSKAFVRAASAAQKAVDYLRDKALGDAADTEEELAQAA